MTRKGNAMALIPIKIKDLPRVKTMSKDDDIVIDQAVGTKVINAGEMIKSLNIKTGTDADFSSKSVFFEVRIPTSTLVIPGAEKVYSVPALYVASARQGLNYGYTYSPTTSTITLAERITQEDIDNTEDGFILVEAVCVTVEGADITSLTSILASSGGATHVGTSFGITVEEKLKDLDSKVADGSDTFAVAYNNGAPIVAGIGSFIVPYPAKAVKTLTMSGSTQYDGINYDYNPSNYTVTLRDGVISEGGEVVIFHINLKSIDGLLQNAIKGFSFSAGGTLHSVNDQIYDEKTKAWFYWTGAYPKIVSSGSEPLGDDWKSSGQERPVNYQGVRSYAGAATTLDVYGMSNIFDRAAGKFYLDIQDSTSLDNGGTLLVDSLGRRWKRAYSGNNHVDWWGAKGEGVSDDRLPLQSAVDASAGKTLEFLGGATYFCSLGDGRHGKTCVDIPSNITLEMNRSTIRCETNAYTNYQIFMLYKVQGVVINDGLFVGDLDTHTGTTGEAGYGVLLRSCDSISINRCRMSKFWGDGLLLGSDTISTNTNIRITHCVFDDNRRQGSSVGGGVGVVYDTCTFSNTGKTQATAPAAGIDIEPDNNKVADLDVKVINCRFINNQGGGIHVILSGCLTAPTLRPGVCEVNVKFIGCTSFQDGSYNTTVSRGSIRVGGAAIAPISNRLFGGVDFTSCTVSRASTSAVRMTNPISAYPPIRFNSLVVTDVYSGVPDGTQMPTSNIVYFDIFPEFTDSPNMNIGDIDFNGLTYKDSRGLTFSETATQSNHRVKRPVWHQNLSPTTSLSKVRFRHFKTDIVPNSLNFLMNGERGDYCSFDTDALFVDVTAAITPAVTGEWWGLGVIPILKGTGNTTFNVHLPSTDGRLGTFQYIKSHLPLGKPLQFHPGTTGGVTNTVVYPDGATSEPKVLGRSVGEFVFYCPSENTWVQQ